MSLHKHTLELIDGTLHIGLDVKPRKLIEASIKTERLRWVFLGCFLIGCVIIGLGTLYLFIGLSSHISWISERRSGVIETTTRRNAIVYDLKHDYMDMNMLNTDFGENKVEDFFKFCCSRKPEFSKRTTKQIRFISQSVNNSIQTSNDNPMNAFFKTCVNVETPIFGTCNDIQFINRINKAKICKNKDIFELVEIVLAIKSVEEFSKMIGVLMECGFLNVLFHISKSKEFFVHHEARQRSTIFISNKMSPNPSNEFKNDYLKFFPWINHIDNIDIGTYYARRIRFSSYNRQNVICDEFDKMNNEVKEQTGFNFEKTIQIVDPKYSTSRGLMCWSSESHMLYFKSNFKRVSLKGWKNYAVFSMIESMFNRIIIPINQIRMLSCESNAEETKKRCLDYTVRKLPSLYCQEYRKRIQDFSVVQTKLEDLSSKLVGFFIKYIEEHDNRGYVLGYYRHLNQKIVSSSIREKYNLLIVNVLKNIRVEFGECPTGGADGANLENAASSDFIGNVFDIFIQKGKGEGEDETGLLVFSQSVYYDTFRHTIVFPIGMLMEPRISATFSDGSLYGIIGFPLYHEIVHSIVEFMKSIGINDFGNINEEEFCDMIARDIMMEYLHHEKISNEEIEKFFITLSQFLFHESTWKNMDIPGVSQHFHPSAKRRIQLIFDGKCQSKFCKKFSNYFG